MPLPPTGTQTHTLTATPGSTLPPAPPAGGPNAIEEHRVVPNPNFGSGALHFKLKGAVDSVELRVYTKSMTCIGRMEAGAQNAGWGKIALPAELAAYGGGLYYYQVKSRRGGQENAEPGIASLMILK